MYTYKIVVIIVIVILASIALQLSLPMLIPKKRNIVKDEFFIREFPDFLSQEQCQTIIQLTDNKLVDSNVYTGSSDSYDTSTRTSKQCWLQYNTHPLLQQIRQRVADITNTHDNYTEDIQIVNYQSGGYFKEHYDGCDGTPEFCARLTQNGQRLYTFLIYLNDDFSGGETQFTRINKSVEPKRGKAILFNNVDSQDKVLYNSMHTGSEIEDGEKWIANIWIHSGSV